MRLAGCMLLNKSNQIALQIIVIYSWLICSLTYWNISTLIDLSHLDRQCFRPLQLSILNTILMVVFYTFVLSPYITILSIMPIYIYQVIKSANRHRQKKLMKHYLVKSMPSIAFKKELFKDSLIMDECLICLEQFNEGEDYVTPLACDKRHLYHSNCIQEWL